MRNVLRNSVGLLGWSAFTLAALAAGVYAVLEHYLAAKDALLLLGTNRMPLIDDELLGVMLGAVAPGLTLAGAMAFTIAVGQAIGLFLFFKLVLSFVSLAQHRRQAVALQQADEVSAANELLISTGLKVLLLVALLWWALNFEWHLFVFRTLASAFDLDEMSAAQMASLPTMIRENSDLFVVGLAGIGATGYIAFTGIPALATEIGLIQASRRFARLAAAVEALNEEWDSTEEATSEDLNAADAPAEANVAASSAPAPAAAATSASGHEPSTDSAEESASATSDDASQTTPDDHRPVHGTAGVTVSLAGAQAQPDRYYIDPSTGYVWDRAYWEELHAVPTTAEAEEAAYSRATLRAWRRSCSRHSPHRPARNREDDVGARDWPVGQSAGGISTTKAFGRWMIGHGKTVNPNSRRCWI